MNIFKRLFGKPSKESLQLEFVELKSKLEAFNTMFAGKVVPLYIIEDNIKLKVRYDVLKYKIEHYED
mgnify:CR=1 FL=1